MADSKCRLDIVNITRWTARILSLLIVTVFVLILIGHLVFPEPESGVWTTIELLAGSFFPVGLCAGLIVGWWREALGGSIVIGCAIAFIVTLWIRDGQILSNPWFILPYTIPGILYLITWAIQRRKIPSKIPPQ